MKTKLFLASALLFAASVSSVFANYTLVGDFNNWGANVQQSHIFTNNTLTITFQGSFKIKDGDTWIGGDNTDLTSTNNTSNLSWGGGSNMNLLFPAEYTLTIQGNTLTVTGFPTSGYYIVGTFNEWKPQQMTANIDGSYSFTRTFTANERFKIRDHTGEFYGGEVKDGDVYHGINDGWRTYISFVKGAAGKDFILKDNPGECTIIFTNDQKLTVLGYGHQLVTLSDGTNNIGTYSDAVDVVINGRTLYKDGFWNSFCLPFSITNFHGTIFEEADVETLSSTSYSDGTLTMNFSFETSIVAGKPYIVKWSSKKDDIVNPTFTNVTISATSPTPVETTYADFLGCFSTTPIAGKEYLFLGDADKVYYPDPSYSVGAFRGYFHLKGVTAGDPTTQGQQSIKAINLNFGDDTNSIQVISNETNAQNDGYYTIDGRRINGMPATSGLYILNGKKVMIK